MKYLSVISLCALAFTISCLSSPVTIRETNSEIDDAVLTKAFGKFYNIRFYSVESAMDERYYNYFLSKTKKSIESDESLTANEKNIKLKELNNYNYEKARLFIFSITHLPQIQREKGATKLIFVDAKGNNNILSIMDVTIRVHSSDGITSYMTQWFIKTIKPVTKDNYADSDLPLKFSVVFFGKQKKEYSVWPK